jgi:hypothetical protein
MGTVFLLAAAVLQEAGGSKGAPHPWGDCREGSWVRLETRQSDGNKEFDRWEERKELTGRKGDRATIKVSSFIREGKASRVKEEESSLAPLTFVPRRGATPAGDETLAIAGRKIACQVWSGKDSRGTLKVWVAKDASALPFPVIREEQDGVEKDRAAVVAWDESVDIGGRTVRCVVVDRHGEGPGYTYRGKQWYSLEVPGGLVRSEDTTVFNKTTTNAQVTRVVAFEKK